MFLGGRRRMMSTSIILTAPQGDLERNEYQFEEHARCVIGRAPDCDIRVPQDYRHADISRHHCLLEIDYPTIRVRDLGSRNGTYVNGAKIGQRPKQPPEEPAERRAALVQELKDGDEIRLGHTVLRVGVVETPDLVKAPGQVPLLFV